MPAHELRTVYRHEIEVVEKDNVRGFGATLDRKAEDLLALALDIEAKGLLEPIVVRWVSPRYEVLDGFRRMAACDLIGMLQIPVSVVSVTDPVEILAIRCTANGGKPLTHAEVGYVCVMLRKEALEQGRTLVSADYEKMLGYSRHFLLSLLRCYDKLEPYILEAWQKRGFPTGTAITFAAMSPSEQKRRWNAYVETGGRTTDLDDPHERGQAHARRVRSPIAINAFATELSAAKLVKVGPTWEPASERERQIIRGVLSWVLSQSAEKPIR